MNRLLILVSALLVVSALRSQAIREKKYPSLLWEISGKGMKKPSFLIGTMHVSNKLAFNLPDSFYIAIRNADVVALETNPETWQEDMTKFDLSAEDDLNSGSQYGEYDNLPSAYFNINTLKFFKYYGKLQRALSSNPSAINNLLYRNYGDQSSDFEEDTYLDMYIFQCGKKWGKKVAGVETYGESMRLMMEAYKDAAKDKKKKDRSYGDWNEAFSNDKLQEAYRTGNLDLLDSINRYNSTSDAFDEKFIYRRNEIQAGSIDSIIKSGSSLFVGVGAAHLPGNRGVIEILRKNGYTVRAVKMGERASKQKELVDKIRVPVVFHTENADDGSFKVDVPGKLYKLSEDPALKQQQFADMANGSYYMVTRIMTNAWMWNQSPADVLVKTDSLLYENIPGKIISRKPIEKSGYKGWDIINRTRRGDLQRYNIFITPFELIIFKMSGNGDYVSQGNEAERFFGSIQLKDHANGSNGWKKFSPSYGGFSVELPQEPYAGNDGSMIFDAEDKTTGSWFRIIRSDIQNFRFIEEDSFDLDLMNESFRSSAFIDSQLLLQPSIHKGYPALDGKYLDKYGQNYFTRFIIQGPHYYTLIARAPKENRAVQQFLNSFEISPFHYGNTKQYRDTSLYFTVNTPVYPDDRKIKLSIPKSYWYSVSQDASKEELSEKEKLLNGVYRNRTFQNDSTGEMVYVTFFHSNRYHTIKDSLAFERNMLLPSLSDSTVVMLQKRKFQLPGNIRAWESIITDTNSSRRLWTRSFYKNGSGFSVTTMIDSLSPPSAFLSGFFDSFTPADTLVGVDVFKKKSDLFFTELMSDDTLLHSRALRHIDDVQLDSTDLAPLSMAIDKIGWNEKKYLDTKISLVDKLGEIRSTGAADKLEKLYYAAGDTLQLQYAALENLLQQQTRYAFALFGRIMVNEPPVYEATSRDYLSRDAWIDIGDSDTDNGSFMDELLDSLQLTKTILPDLLPLVNLRDYERTMMRLLSALLDSDLVKPSDYREYFSKFFIEAKQELKKQAIAEKKKAIEKVEKDKADEKDIYSDDNTDKGNADLSLYASLLLPFADQNPNVSLFISQLLRSGDKRLRLNTMVLLMQKKKAVPDSLIESLASDENFRFELYTEIKKTGMPERFPTKWNNHVDLSKSALLYLKNYDKPDTMVYLERRIISYKGKKGFIYFFKYKMKSIDLNWKIATVGLVPEDPAAFDCDASREYDWIIKRSTLSGFSNQKIREGKDIGQQLDKIIKQWQVSQHNSGKEFYTGDEGEEENENE